MSESGKVSLPTPERIEEIKPYFTNEQLDELSREYRTMPTDGEGYAIEPEYEGMIARGYIVKLISDVKTARTALEEVERKHGDTGNALEIKRMLLEKANYEAGRQRVFKESAEKKLAEAQQTIARQGEIIHGIDRDLTKLRLALVAIAGMDVIGSSAISMKSIAQEALREGAKES